MPAMKLLLARRGELMKLLRGLPDWTQPALEQLVERSLDAYQARSEAIARRNQARGAAVRAKVRDAAGVVPAIDPDRWGSVGVTLKRIRNRGPEAFGLPDEPDERTVRAALRERGVPVLACTDWANGAAYGSTTPTT